MRAIVPVKEMKAPHPYPFLRMLIVALVCGAAMLCARAHPVRPLAQDFVIIGTSPDPKKIPLHNPSIVALPSGRLVAAYSQSNKHDRTQPSGTHVLTSDDGGISWQARAELKRLGQARLILAGNSVYLVGSGLGMYISRSQDQGQTWSEPAFIAKGPWHQSATNFIYANGNIYLAIEKRIGKEINAWYVGELSPILMRAKATDDLTRPEAWSFSEALAFKDIIKGYRENALDIDYFGVPFFKSNFPERTLLTPPNMRPARNDSPPGWLEANVAQITDPTHLWYDASGHTFHILLRAHTGGTGYAALVKVIETPDGRMRTVLEKAPSGKQMLFLPMAVGHLRFHLLYDEKTRLFWLLGSQSTDSMTRPETLGRDRFGAPNNERNRLVLYFSKNLVDWSFAGVVAIGATDKDARHYAAMSIDGDDLVILSRSADARARSAHDGNLITFHRVKNFRELVY